MEDPAFATLETERLVARRFDEMDVAAFVAYRNDPNVAELQGWDLLYETSEAIEFIDGLRGIAPGTRGAWFQFAVGLSGSGDLIGDVALRTTSEDPTHAELGFSFAPDFQGCGYASSRPRGRRRRDDRAPNWRIFAITDSYNVRARKLLESLSFRLEQTIANSAVLYSIESEVSR